MICIIFNKVNHISMIAAAFASAIMRRNYTAKVVMVDIRDNIPEDAKAYLWLDSGTPNDMTRATILAGTVNGVPPKLSYIEKHSEVIDTTPDESGGWFEVSIAKLGRKFYDEKAITVEELRAMTQIAKACLDYHRDEKNFKYYFNESAEVELRKEDVIGTIDAILSNARRYYYGEQEDFISTRSGKIINPLEDKSFYPVEYLPETPDILTRLVDTANIGNIRAKFITTTDPHVYALLRRLAITKQSFIHVSSGMNGMVVYSNEVIPETGRVSNLQSFINLGFKA